MTGGALVKESPSHPRLLGPLTGEDQRKRQGGVPRGSQGRDRTMAPLRWARLLLGLQDLAAIVIATVGADRVGPLEPLTLAAGRQRGPFERQVGAPAALVWLRSTLLGDRND